MVDFETTELQYPMKDFKMGIETNRLALRLMDERAQVYNVNFLSPSVGGNRQNSNMTHSNRFLEHGVLLRTASAGANHSWCVE